MALAAYDGERSAVAEKLWAEVLCEALEAAPSTRTFSELSEVLESIPRKGEVFQGLSLLVREQVQVDPNRSVESFVREHSHG